MKRIITFKQNEKELFDFLSTKRNVSVYIKDLVQADMDKNKSVETEYKMFPPKNSFDNLISYNKAKNEQEESNNQAYDDF